VGKADLHAHTCQDGWGDGNQRVADLLAFVEQHTDLDLFAVTDHDSTIAARAAWELHQSGSYRFELLPGVEVTNQAGHLLCYFPHGEIFDIPSLRPFWWTVRYARERGAICIPAHAVYAPWLATTIRRGLQYGEELDGIEAVNAGIGDAARERLLHLAQDFSDRVALVGNSDAHDQAAVGAAYTAFPGNTASDFLYALRERQTEPVYVRRPQLSARARRFTTRRSMTRPGWAGNLWREYIGRAVHLRRER